jgi:hypothetical protein
MPDLTQHSGACILRHINSLLASNRLATQVRLAQRSNHTTFGFSSHN